MRLYCCPVTTQEKTNFISSTTVAYQKFPSVNCSKALLLNPFSWKHSENWDFYTNFHSKKLWRYHLCCMNWKHNHTMKRKFLCTWLVKLTRLLRFISMILLNFQIFTLGRKKCSTTFCSFRFKVSIHKVFHK